MSVKISVIDRKDKAIADFTEERSEFSKMTVEQLMRKIIKSSEYLSKKKFDINRMRLTVGDAKGLALSDKRTLLDKIFQEETVVKLVFKDLGPQISWKLVFLIEYFGPILITVFLMIF